MSAHECEQLPRLPAVERRVYQTEDLPAEIAEAIQKSKMNPAHNYLNGLLNVHTSLSTCNRYLYEVREMEYV